LVGKPVEGPPRITLTITAGVSEATARPIPSSIKARPGPEVAVMAGTPPKEAPITMLIDASSSSACSSCPPSFSSLGDSHSSRSLAGVIG
jgi:hypothetical protein